MYSKLIGAAAALAVFVGGAASAETLHFAGMLRGADETPPNNSPGTGQVVGTLDTANRNFTYTVTYAGLTGPATAAHFHGPAAPGASAGPQLAVATSALANPIHGTGVLEASQVKDLEAGKWYFNIHTAAHPGGEVRAQITQGH